MAKFSIAYSKTMAHEGLYSNDPSDRGGETYMGIARKFHADWDGWAIVDRIKEEVSKYNLKAALNANPVLKTKVQDFYKKVFWDVLNLDRLQCQEIADELFDTGVNQGSGSAAKYFQMSLNLLNYNGKHFSDLKVDGDIGTKTLAAYNAYMLTAQFRSRSVPRNTSTLLKAMSFFQAKKYFLICEADPGQEKYFYGWLNRV